MSVPYRILLVLKLLLLPYLNTAQDFISTEGQRFLRNGRPYYYIGANFWYGMNLGNPATPSNRERLQRELDRLQALGINNLRIMAASEGPDTEPWRMVPALQTEPGVYNDQLLLGLDYLLLELSKRDMHAVLCLNNMWPWSGGFAQYLNWVTGEDIPYPPPAEGGQWLRYINFAGRFFKNEAAQQLYLDHVAVIINRINSLSGIPYREDPTIMSWQLANEPRAVLGGRRYRKWIRKTAAFIRQLDSNHLISIGSEGNAFLPFSRKFTREHRIKNIDYATAHVWIQNWSWYDPAVAETSFPKALQRAKKYVERHIRLSRRLDMPFVLEEFGIARDGGSYDHQATTRYRDQYFRQIFAVLYQAAQMGWPAAGANIWAWAGEGRPREPKAIWKAGDDFTGDPPFEHQGWYSVYDQDDSTLEVIRQFTGLFDAL